MFLQKKEQEEALIKKKDSRGIISRKMSKERSQKVFKKLHEENLKKQKERNMPKEVKKEIQGSSQKITEKLYREAQNKG